MKALQPVMILVFAALLTATGCQNSKVKPAADSKKSAPAEKVKTEKKGAIQDPYEETKEEAKLDETLDKIAGQDTGDKTRTPADVKKAKPVEDAATQAAKDKIIAGLFPAMHVDEQLDNLRQGISETVAQQFIQYLQQTLTRKKLYNEENAQYLDKNFPGYMEKLMSSTVKLIDTEKVKKNILAPAYKDTYTLEELQTMKVFFESPAGQAYIEKSPGISQTLLQKIGEQNSPQIEALIKEVANAAIKDLDNKPKSAPEKTPGK